MNIINRNTSKDEDASHLLRCLAFVREKYNFFLFATHIVGKNKTIADALSHNKIPLFRSLHPQAQLRPSVIPEALLDLLIVQKPDWLSPTWTMLWSSIFPID